MRRRRRLQYFWEVFPAQDGLTTYMFAYCDPSKGAKAFQHPHHSRKVASPTSPKLKRAFCLMSVFPMLSSMHAMNSGACLGSPPTHHIFCPGRPSLTEMFSDYLELLPQYRGVPDLRGVRCLRPFFGFVPNWHDSPLAPVTSRLLHIGDAAGNRSALSFAGQASVGILDQVSWHMSALVVLPEGYKCLGGFPERSTATDGVQTGM